MRVLFIVSLIDDISKSWWAGPLMFLTAHDLFGHFETHVWLLAQIRRTCHKAAMVISWGMVVHLPVLEAKFVHNFFHFVYLFACCCGTLRHI